MITIDKSRFSAEQLAQYEALVAIGKADVDPKAAEEEMEEAVRELKNKEKSKKKKVITIEVDEDDDSYADLEVRNEGATPRVESARPKTDGKQKADLPYRKPTKIEMLSADEDEE